MSAQLANIFPNLRLGGKFRRNVYLAIARAAELAHIGPELPLAVWRIIKEALRRGGVSVTWTFGQLVNFFGLLMTKARAPINGHGPANQEPPLLVEEVPSETIVEMSTLITQGESKGKQAAASTTPGTATRQGRAQHEYHHAERGDIDQFL